MARPIKKGLTYFPLDVDFFTDDKLLFVAARFEEKGELVAIKLLCKIYKNGYHIEWNNDTALLFAKSAGSNVSVGLVNEVVNELVKRDFFSKDIYTRFAVLTSSGIQERYTKICKDAKRTNCEIALNFLLNQLTPEKTELTTELMPVNPRKSTQSKEKESKEKESINYKGENLSDQSMWLDSICIKHKLKSHSDVSGWIQKFNVHLDSQSQVYLIEIPAQTNRIEQDYKKHFNSWLQIQLKNLPKESIKPKYKEFGV